MISTIRDYLVAKGQWAEDRSWICNPMMGIKNADRRNIDSVVCVGAEARVREPVQPFNQVHDVESESVTVEIWESAKSVEAWNEWVELHGAI